jgi:hypothetical protein
MSVSLVHALKTIDFRHTTGAWCLGAYLTQPYGLPAGKGSGPIQPRAATTAAQRSPAALRLLKTRRRPTIGRQRRRGGSATEHREGASRRRIAARGETQRPPSQMAPSHACLLLALSAGAAHADPWRSGYVAYRPNVTRGFIVDANQPTALLRENHDATIQWFDGHFFAAFNGARNASEINRWQLNQVASSADGIVWGAPTPLNEGGCHDDAVTSCQQWQPSMAVIRRQQAKKPPALWAFWCQFQGATTHSANFSQSAWFMSALEPGGGAWTHRRFDAPTRDTSGRDWILFPTQNPVQLASGRVLVPVSMMPDGPTHHKGGVSSVLYTDDGGATFQLSPGTPEASIVPATDSWEPAVWEEVHHPGHHSLGGAASSSVGRASSSSSSSSSSLSSSSSSSTVHMVIRAVSYGVRSDEVLQHAVSHNQGCTWQPLQVLPIETVPNRPGIGTWGTGGDTGGASQHSERVLMLDSDWSPTATLTTSAESCRFNLAMFFARPGDGPRFTAGFGLTGEEDFVMYPQWTAVNGSLFVAYSQGMVRRSIKFARVTPLPDPARFFVFPRSDYVGDSGLPTGNADNQLHLCGGSAGVDLDGTNRANGDSVRLQIQFRVHAASTRNENGGTVTVVTIGDAATPLRLQVEQDFSLNVAVGHSKFALLPSVEVGQWITVSVESGGAFTNVSTTPVTDHGATEEHRMASVSVPHAPSNTWVYLGEGFSTGAATDEHFFVAGRQLPKRPRATNFSLISHLHPLNYTGPGCSELPRPHNATLQQVVDSCFALSSKIDGIVGFWVYDHPRLDERHTRCCPKSSYSTSAWKNQSASGVGAFYQLTNFITPNVTTARCLAFNLSLLRTQVTRP